MGFDVFENYFYLILFKLIKTDDLYLNYIKNKI